MTEYKIECPKCEWEPDGGAYWGCNCGMIWNTFDTQGVCPRCNKRWQDTQCPSCQKWSPHIDWYHIPLNLDELLATKEEAK